MKEIGFKASDKEKDENKKSGLVVINSDFSCEDELCYYDHYVYDKNNEIYSWGEDNMLPDFLVKVAKYKSAKHAAIINKKCKFISGNGFVNSDDEGQSSFLVNPTGSHPLNDLVKLVTADYEILNMFAIGVRWNSDKSRIAALDYIPMYKVRIGDGFVKISDNWLEPKAKDSNTITRSLFNTKPLPENFSELEEEEKKYFLNQVFVYSNMQVASDIYSSPSYSAGLNWILADAGISGFTLNMIKKNFSGGYHINISSGIPEEEERKKFKKDFKKEYTGEGAESILITFSEPDATNTPEVKPLPSTGNENIYHETEMRAQENIFIAHEVINPVLFGVKIEGGLGGNTKDVLKESLSIFQIAYLDQRQADIESVFNKLMSVNHPISEPLQLKKYSLETENELDNEEGDALARKIAKLDDAIKAKVLENLSKEQILSMAGVIVQEDVQPTVENVQPEIQENEQDN